MTILFIDNAKRSETYIIFGGTLNSSSFYIITESTTNEPNRADNEVKPRKLDGLKKSNFRHMP